jgi:NADH-quinone oxidoreductase subunit A
LEKKLKTLRNNRSEPKFCATFGLSFLQILSIMTPINPLTEYIPIALMFLVAIGFVLTTMFATHWLGPKRRSKLKLEAFECGIESQGNARIPFSIKYFLVAILFVLFDVEVIFMYPWAVNFKELGWFGFIEMITFMGFLLVGFFYIIRRGALKWE